MLIDKSIRVKVLFVRLVRNSTDLFTTFEKVGWVI